jgi:YihY family inner membrane protein
MSSLWALGGLSWKELGKRVISEIQSDDVFGRAAQLAYYFLLALFPLLLFLTSVIGLLRGSGTGVRHALFTYLSRVLPGSASDLVDSTMYEVSAASGGGKVTFGLLAAIWAASNGMGAITEALNAAYNVKESRPWWKQRLTAIGLTLVLSILIISALVLVLYGARSQIRSRLCTVAKKLESRYAEILRGGQLPFKVWISDKPLFARGSKYRGQPIVLSEVGGFLAIPQGIPAEKRDMLYQFYDSFRTPQELLEKYRDLMKGLATLTFLAGFCYTQLTDIEQEINGLLTYDRQPKLASEDVALINRESFEFQRPASR